MYVYKPYTYRILSPKKVSYAYVWPPILHRFATHLLFFCSWNLFLWLTGWIFAPLCFSLRICMVPALQQMSSEWNYCLLTFYSQIHDFYQRDKRIFFITKVVIILWFVCVQFNPFLLFVRVVEFRELRK